MLGLPSKSIVYDDAAELFSIDKLVTVAIACAGMRVVIVPATESMTRYISRGAPATSAFVLIRNLVPRTSNRIDTVFLCPPESITIAAEYATPCASWAASAPGSVASNSPGRKRRMRVMRSGTSHDVQPAASDATQSGHRERAVGGVVARGSSRV